MARDGSLPIKLEKAALIDLEPCTEWKSSKFAELFAFDYLNNRE